MGAGWFALKGVSDQGGGVGRPGQRVCGGLQASHAPQRPKQRPWYLGFIYLLQLKLSSLEGSQAFCLLLKATILSSGWQPFLLGFVYLL